MSSEVLILSAVRTPIGSFQGALSTVPAPQLGAIAIAAAVARAGVDPAALDEAIMGNVISAGLGQNPARQAAIGAGLPDSVGALTINKVCGSGLKAVMLAAQAIRLGDADQIVAGGMENMSLAPYLLPQARSGYRMGDGQLIDAMIRDGLWDCYGGKHMGVYGDQCGARYDFSRTAQDDFAVRSYERARQAIADGLFQEEITPVEVSTRKGSVKVEQDEEPFRFEEEKLRRLKPAFSETGTITAGNASTINDGAAAIVLASAGVRDALGAEPLGRVAGAATFSGEPQWFTTAPIGALSRLLDKLNWSVADVDLFEVNEAFAVVAMAAEKELAIPAEKLNVHGGAVALGHPIGCSGARILVTLLHALKQRGGRRGVACLCIGGGEAVAVGVER
ncbi:thiolase family protein [Lignipirellula cremea]|uniref:Acetyl-CoA acetyltransferase n=1 Tax=Lignipirellula cremea TaxID=2528010 RepID=A0A518DN18_9BACT|nr:acetyl-CoA C-acyltransferase [Lignipirellula cremea]QDU93222.1 Acetyl-CoA acetyltransferase [Lignipirellula cremea]